MYPDDLDIPEGEDKAKFLATAAGEIRAKGNENFKAVSLRSRALLLRPICITFRSFCFMGLR